MSQTVGLIARDNLMTRVYLELRSALMEGRLWPGDRLKIRQLALALGVSETPVREALIQLVRERGLDMQAAKAITVPELSLAQYLELRSVRFHLEGMAAEAATRLITTGEIKRLRELHRAIVAAEKVEDWAQAVRSNWLFHQTIYRAAEMPELLAILEGIWLRNGPLINYQYPHAKPTYPGRHQHLNILDGLEARDALAVKKGVQADMMEGPALLIELLKRIEGGDVDKRDLRRVSSLIVAAQNGVRKKAAARRTPATGKVKGNIRARYIRPRCSWAMLGGSFRLRR
jgi:DNA-binding GntR family transcriptional regulator